MIKNGVKCVPKSDKKSEELPRKQFFRDGCSGKHVEKDDSAKCGLIDSMGRKQKTIIINDRGHVNKDDKGSTLIRGSAYAMRCFQNTPRVRCVLALKQKREALLGPPFSFEVD